MDDWQAPKFDPVVPLFTRLYCFVHYWILTVAGLTAVILGSNYPLALSLACFVVIVGSLYIHSRLLEGTAPVQLEWSRLLTLAAAGWAAPLIWPVLPTWLTAATLLYCLLSAISLALAGWRHKFTLPV